jgi:hypothetical protein
MSTMPKLSGHASLAGSKGQTQAELGAKRNNSVAAESQLALGNQAMLQGLASGTEISGFRHPLPLPLRPILGNQGTVLRLQTKLRVNTPGDMHEQEADRVAERVMRMPTNGAPTGLRATSTAAGVQRKCSCSGSGGKCSQCQEGEPMVRRTAASPTAPGHAPPIVRQALQSSGRPLDSSTRVSMESRFGQDFSGVRVHTDPLANASANAINALAYTAGTDVIFGAGQFSPNTASGQKLLAHELTHVVQQTRGGVSRMSIQRQPRDDDDERIAREMRQSTDALAALHSGQARVVAAPPTTSLAGVPGALELQQKLIDQGVLQRPTGPPPVVWLGKTRPDAKMIKIATQMFQHPRPGKLVVGGPHYAPGELELREKLAAQGVPFAGVPRRTPPPADAKRAGPDLRLIATGQWSQKFITGFAGALATDEQLKADLAELDAQLDTGEGKAKFGLGLAAGFTAGALSSMGDLGYVPFKMYLEAGFATRFGHMSEKEIEKKYEEYKTALKQLVDRAPELLTMVAERPDEVGKIAGQLASQKFRKEILLEEGLPPLTDEMTKGLDPKNPMDISGLRLPGSLADITKSRLTVGEKGEQRKHVYNKGVAMGEAAGYALLEIVQLFVGVEEMKAAIGGAEALKALKETELGKKVSALIDTVPELKRLKTATEEVKATEKGVESLEKGGGTLEKGAGALAGARREPTIARFGQAEVDELVAFWKKKIESTQDPALIQHYQKAIDILEKRGRVRFKSGFNQSEEEMTYIYSLIGGKGQVGYIHGREATKVGEAVTIPDITAPNVLAEVKNWNVIHIDDPSTAEKMLKDLGDQIATRRVHGPADIKAQTVILDIRGQGASNDILQTLGETFAERSGLPIENIQIVVWDK